MQSTTNYGLNIVEGTDIVNPLTQFNPNFTDIDSIMKNNADASIDHATCIKTGTVHAVTRTNTDANVFRFTATGNWNTGDTMTVDGTLVSVYVSDGTAPANGCFIINTEVLASIQGTRVTLYVNSGNANNISYDNTSSGLSASNVQDAIDELKTDVDSAAQGTGLIRTENKTVNASGDEMIYPLPTNYIPLSIRCLDTGYNNTYDIAQAIKDGMQVIYGSNNIRFINGTARNYVITLNYMLNNQ